MYNEIPLPDELECLEATSRFHEDNIHPSSPDLYPYPSEEERSPSPDPQINGPKRRRQSDGQNSSDLEHTIDLDHPKRSKVEDWLRHSPVWEAEENGEEEIAEVVLEEEKKEEEEKVEEERILSRYASETDGEFFPVTAPSGGDRVYAKVSRVWKEGESCRNMCLKSQLHGEGLTSEPIDVLLQRVEQEAFTKALHASSEIQSDAVHPETHVAHERLWVDKYAPNSFTELLSDEQTNREVLLWLKQWDETVFGSEIISTSDEVLSALRRHSSAVHHKKSSDSSFLKKNRDDKWNNGNVRSSSNVSDHTNSHSKRIQDLQKSKLTGPPEHKILLLCGPPGLGKTTLAHVAAKHCGYRVVEVNASDDRSTSAIEAKILDVIQMNSVIADSRPKCLVIDEIDGALADGKGAVEVILKMVSGDRKSNNGKENILSGEQAGRISSKKGHKTASLLRPVICICNDLYTPALRPLRQVAKVHIFVQPTVSRVISRLKYICNKEGMTANSISLAALAEYTECDIRSCLNTLQFLNKKKETLNVLEIGTQVVGRKDTSRSAFDIWKEIFHKRKVKRDRQSSGSMVNDFNYLLSLVSNRGDYDLILDGIHENILQIKYHDPVMQKTVKCFNGLGIFDLMHQTTMRTQQMSLLAYQPPLAIIIHHLVAQIQKQTIEWPKSYQRYRTTLMEKMDILRSWQNQMPPFIYRHLSIKSFVEDSISPLLHMLSPSMLRPVELTKKVTEQVRILAKDEDEELAETSSFDVIPPYDQAKALGKTIIDIDRIAAGLPCGSEGFLLMYARWRKLERDLYNERKERFDITQIPDVYDSCKYDLLHNAHLKLEGLRELFKVAQLLADGVIPNEYGINPRQKLKIGSKIARRLLGKILIDLRNTREEAISVAKLKTTQDHPATSEKTEKEETDQPKFFIKAEDSRRTSTASEMSIDQDEDDDKETKYRLDPKYANVRTPDRHVRTRLYFTSESHIHSLMNVLRYCNLDESLQEEDSLVCYSALERLFKTRELDYMSYIVLRMFENTEVALEDPKRFRIEMTFSRGADLSPLEKNNSEAASLHQEHTLPIMGPERLQDMGSYLTLEKMETMVRPFAMPAEDFPPPSTPAGFSGYFSKSAAVLERLVNLWPFHKQEKHAATNGK